MPASADRKVRSYLLVSRSPILPSHAVVPYEPEVVLGHLLFLLCQYITSIFIILFVLFCPECSSFGVLKLCVYQVLQRFFQTKKY